MRILPARIIAELRQKSQRAAELDILRFQVKPKLRVYASTVILLLLLTGYRTREATGQELEIHESLNSLIRYHAISLSQFN